MRKRLSGIAAAMLLFSGTLFGQAADVGQATLQYDLSEVAPAATVDASPGAQPQGIQAPGSSPATASQTNLIELLLEKMGKKEQKIVRSVLEAGVENKLINLQKIEKQLGKFNVPALIGLYSDLRALKISRLDFKKIENIKTTLTQIDAAIKKADIKSPDFGNLSFFAGMARDRLASVSDSETEKSQLRAAAIENYSATINALADDKSVAAQEKLADSQERLETLSQPFGKLVPVEPAKGKSKAVITSDYGTRIHPVKKTKRFHTGVDLAGWKCNGWKVMAIGPGRVVKSGWESGYGYSVVVSHEIDGRMLFTRYAHLQKKNRLPVGSLVKSGELLGYCNNTGISTGAHLHFEVRETSASGETLDPKGFLPPVDSL